MRLLLVRRREGDPAADVVRRAILVDTEAAEMAVRTIEDVCEMAGRWGRRGGRLRGAAHRSAPPRLHERQARCVLRAARSRADDGAGRRPRGADVGVHPPRRAPVRRQLRVPAATASSTAGSARRWPAPGRRLPRRPAWSPTCSAVGPPGLRLPRWPSRSFAVASGWTASKKSGWSSRCRGRRRTRRARRMGAEYRFELRAERGAPRPTSCRADESRSRSTGRSSTGPDPPGGSTDAREDLRAAFHSSGEPCDPRDGFAERSWSVDPPHGSTAGNNAPMNPITRRTRRLRFSAARPGDGGLRSTSRTSMRRLLVRPPGATPFRERSWRTRSRPTPTPRCCEGSRRTASDSRSWVRSSWRSRSAPAQRPTGSSSMASARPMRTCARRSAAAPSSTRSPSVPSTRSWPAAPAGSGCASIRHRRRDACAPGDRSRRLEVRDRAGRGAGGGATAPSGWRSVASIGAHIGSDISDLQPFGELARMLGGLADELGADGVDLGGGWAGPPATYAAAVRPHLSDRGSRGRRARARHRRRRGLAADERGARPGSRTPGGRRGHDRAAAADAVRRPPPGRGAPPGAGVLPDRRWTLAGPICEAGDLLADDLDLGPAAGEGALLAISGVGAYGVAMASNYNGRLRPAQAVIEGGGVRLSRRRETLDDLVARDA